MRPFSRRAALSAIAMLALAACGSATGEDSAESANSNSNGLPDMVLGEADAPVTLVEYASITCGACLQFHQQVLPEIKEKYVEPGHVKFVFREFPTPPANVAVAGFALARCAQAEQGGNTYFDVIDDLFDAQPGLLAAARQGAVRPALETLAARHGISQGEEFDTCLNNSSIRDDIADVILSGEEFNVASTPTLILQGRALDNTIQARTPEGLSELIDLELQATGVDIGADDSPSETDADAPVDAQ